MIAASEQPGPETTVLVTGAGGQLGRVLAQRLSTLACRTRLLVRRPEQARSLPEGAEVVVGDVTDPASLELATQGADVVLHLAAATRGGSREFEQTNIQGTRNVIAACLRAQPCRLVHVSSLGVLDHAGRRHSDGPLREDARLEPFAERRGLYTRTKLAAEQEVRDAIRTRGLRAVILRPGQILGPGCETVTPNGVVALWGWNLIGDGSALLPLVCADDVVDAIVLAAFRPGIDGRIFHIVDTTPVTQNQYLEAWKRCVADVPLRRIPEALALILAGMAEFAARLTGRVAPVNPYRIRSLRPLSGFDTSQATDVLGWVPRVGVRRGLEQYFGKARGP